jgi:hypothetical protein
MPTTAQARARRMFGTDRDKYCVTRQAMYFISFSVSLKGADAPGCIEQRRWLTAAASHFISPWAVSFQLVWYPLE